MNIQNINSSSTSPSFFENSENSSGVKTQEVANQVFNNKGPDSFPSLSHSKDYVNLDDIFGPPNQNYEEAPSYLDIFEPPLLPKDQELAPPLQDQQGNLDQPQKPPIPEEASDLFLSATRAGILLDPSELEMDDGLTSKGHFFGPFQTSFSENSAHENVFAGRRSPDLDNPTTLMDGIFSEPLSENQIPTQDQPTSSDGAYENIFSSRGSPDLDNPTTLTDGIFSEPLSENRVSDATPTQDQSTSSSSRKRKKPETEKNRELKKEQKIRRIQRSFNPWDLCYHTYGDRKTLCYVVQSGDRKVCIKNLKSTREKWALKLFLDPIPENLSATDAEINQFRLEVEKRRQKQLEAQSTKEMIRDSMQQNGFSINDEIEATLKGRKVRARIHSFAPDLLILETADGKQFTRTINSKDMRIISSAQASSSKTEEH